MKWPTPQEYNEAIQNCRSNFNDTELQQFSPELNKIGMPKPCSGQFATVYRVSNGSKAYAVRCFLNHYPDQEQRYAAISNHLKAKNLPCMVPFEFQSKGIRVNGSWYPILKMEWITGDKIDAFLYKNLANPAVLNDMATRWLSTMKLLRDTGIAHGDLQHGNIIVSQGVLKLIDYDGMFVPALKGFETHEVGHRNYQHPKRGNADFSPELDNFSAWVIYASIVGLSVDKNFWAYAKAGDERLLLSEGDYRAPAKSDILDWMTKNGNAKLKWMAEQLGTFPSLPVLQIPKLDAMSIPNFSAPQTAVAGGIQNATSAASWLFQNAKVVAPKTCPSCGRRLVMRNVPGLGVPYWQCEASPACKYIKNDGEDVEHIVVPSAKAAVSAGNIGNTNLVFLDPTATGAPIGQAFNSSASASSPLSSSSSLHSTASPSSSSPSASPSSSSGANAGTSSAAYYTASTFSKSGAKYRRTSKAAPVCPHCGAATIITKTAKPQRMCIQFPTCLYSENA